MLCSVGVVEKGLRHAHVLRSVGYYLTTCVTCAVLRYLWMISVCGMRCPVLAIV